MRHSSRPTEHSAALLIFISLGLLFAVCLLDGVTRITASLSFFYLLPIYLAAWYGGTLAGISIALLSYVVMEFAAFAFNAKENLIELRNPNSLSTLLFFLFSAILMGRLRTAFRREHELSSHDGLTGVFNRREFFYLAEIERLRAIRYARAMTLVFLDLDDFKAVNDRFGHAAGDTLLITVAKTLKDCVRGTDLVARLGGDEFIVLLEETDASDARPIVTKLRESLADQLAQTSCPVTASMGVMTFAVPPASVDAMVHAAVLQACLVAGSSPGSFGLAVEPGHAVTADDVLHVGRAIVWLDPAGA